VEEVNSVDVLSKMKMDERREQQKRKREQNTLKQDKIDQEAFSEVGKLEKHIPLEVIDFDSQPPFKGGIEKLQVLVRWKHDEDGNY
jgi:ADP-glucose pyrophosphorylase